MAGPESTVFGLARQNCLWVGPSSAARATPDGSVTLTPFVTKRSLTSVHSSRSLMQRDAVAIIVVRERSPPGAGGGRVSPRFPDAAPRPRR